MNEAEHDTKGQEFMNPPLCWCGKNAQWFYNSMANASPVVSWFTDDAGKTVPLTGLCQDHQPLYEIKEIRRAQYGPPWAPANIAAQARREEM